MKYSMLFTVVLSTLFLISSCGSQRNFSKRKYTNGTFRVANKHYKKNRAAREESGPMASVIQDEHVVEYRSESISEETIPNFAPETVEQDEVVSFSDFPEEEMKPEAISVVVDHSLSEQQKPRAHISDIDKKKREKKNKKELTTAQKQARSSLIWGIVGASLAIALIVLSFFAFPASSPYLFLYIGRSIRVSLIPALFGIVYGTVAKFGNQDLGKYEKHRKAGFWISVSTVILWILLA